MDGIRSIIRLADDKVSEGDLQGAISYFESAFKESETANYIGGLFCCSKRLGDIYYYTNCHEHAVSWYEYADQLLKEEYFSESIILKEAMSVWENGKALCLSNSNLSDKANYYIQKIESHSESSAKVEANEDYETLIKKQENENKLYDNFFNSCRKNSLRLVLRYIHKGLDINRINPQTKYTALHNACWRGHKDVVCALLRHGADMNILNGEGETSLQCAEVAKKTEIVEILKRVESEGIGFLGPCAECQHSYICYLKQRV